jgi:RNA polymerase primary sigma factor
MSFWNIGYAAFIFGVAMAEKSTFPAEDLTETYFRQIKAFPLLSFEEEVELAKRIQADDQEALHKLVNSNLRLVVKVARVYISRGIPFLDLIQEGNLGLMHAARKFSYLKNARFCTYASWWIRQFIVRYLANKRRMVRLPHRKEEIHRKIQHAYHFLCQTLMHQPSSEDIAGELGIPVQDVDFIVNMSAGTLCLELDPSSEENSAIMECHADYTYSPERTFLKKFSHDGTMRFLDILKDREKKVLTYRYQLDGCERHTLKNISDKMGLSPETIRQIELKALNKIRSRAEELKGVVFEEAI